MVGLIHSVPCPTSDSILNKKFAGWDGVIVLKAVERSEGTVVTDIPRYQKTEDYAGKFGVHRVSQILEQAWRSVCECVDLKWSKQRTA